MKTIIFDIDGTLTDMWPIEKAVLLNMLGDSYSNKIDSLRAAGITDTYKIFNRLSKEKLRKKKYYFLYNEAFKKLEQNNFIPNLREYPIVNWIRKNGTKYNFIYATGGQQMETDYVLKCLKINSLFDLSRSINKNNYRFSKGSGMPFKKIAKTTNDIILITDSKQDCMGANKANIPYILVQPGQSFNYTYI